MSQAVDFDLKQFVLENESFGPAEVDQIANYLGQDFGRYRLLREAIQQLEQSGNSVPHAKLRLGICYFLLGRYHQASGYLQSESGGLAKYYLGRSLLGVEDYAKAAEAFEGAGKGFDHDRAALGRAEALRQAGEAKQALAILDKLSGAVEQTAEYLYQRAATVSALKGNTQEVVALYERAVQVDPHHSGALFGLALENDRHGNDDEAISLYERSLTRAPAHVGTLLNLGVLYEDRHQYERARQCYHRILEEYPMQPRARLFLRDSMASGDMFVDEDAQRKRDRLSQILNVPVTDFELSVRARNCLQKMGINTLGDLTTTSEQELLASKNFGETSLVEIKELLASKGLSLGQFAQEKVKVEQQFEMQTMSPDEQAVLSRPISELNLSVRARKCMMRLNIITMGDLLRHTGDELLECKNFGVTSLNEVREKLTQYNLRLRGD